MKVLIVEDNADDRKLLRLNLERHGCQPLIEAGDGQDGLERARAHCPDLIISDALMPRLDGFQFLRAIKSDPQLQAIPFIFYSATYTGVQEAEFALSQGAAAFIIKPMEPEELWQRIRSIMADWEMRQKEAADHAAVDESGTDFFHHYSYIVATKLETKALELEEALEKRKLAEEEVRILNAALEQKVKDRTAALDQRSKELEESRQALMKLVDELKVTNETLSAEIRQRKLAQQEISLLNNDLLQQKARLEAANKELESFCSSISHDLGAPLRHIDTFTALIQNEHVAGLDDTVRDYLQRIRTDCQHMTALINALLELSRLSRNPLQREEIDLSAMAHDIIDQLLLSAPTRQADVRIAEGVRITGDATLLRAVMENLLGNAWKYTRKKTETRIEFGVTQSAGKPVYFVQDNGAGFDMHYADKLFRVFQRLHARNEFEGSGVGLATVQRIIHRHGGRIWAEGKVGEGATFYFTL